VARDRRSLVNARYQNSMNSALSATIPTVSGYTMVGPRIGYTQSNGHSALWADNLTNQPGINSCTDPSQWGQYCQALVSRPRTVGITARNSFKKSSKSA
jgi:hypothetical protein